MKIKLTLSLFLLSTSLMLTSQNEPASTEANRRRCGTDAPPPQWDEWFNKQVEKYTAEMSQNKSKPSSLTIPVIVHVIHGGQAVNTFPNISNTQIKSQIKVLNDDFAGKGFNSNKLATTGFSLVGAANTNITFCLAQFDPNGNPLPEPGVDRVNYNAQGWTNPAAQTSYSGFKALMDGTVKPNTIWDPTVYFNIWVCDAHPNTYLLGYATFPGGTSLNGVTGNFGTNTSDGIWVWARAFGTGVGGLDPLYNRGRTAVHETGHWLGLRHIGGDASNPAGDCNATDFCNDTPPQKGGYGSGSNGQNYGSPAYPLHVNICGSAYGDMFMNFMDYTEDAALYMFTPDQSTRMNTAMAEGYYRMYLSASSATQCVGIPAVELLTDQTVCTGAEVSMVSVTTGSSSTTTFTWSANPSNGVTFTPNASVGNPGITFSVPGNYTITAIASNSIGTTTNYEEVVVSGCVGIKNNQPHNKLTIAPNPASENIHIRSSIKGEDLQVVVYNSLGQKVISQQMRNSASGDYRLSIENLTNGVYFLSVENGKESAVERFVVVH